MRNFPAHYLLPPQMEAKIVPCGVSLQMDLFWSNLSTSLCPSKKIMISDFRLDKPERLKPLLEGLFLAWDISRECILTIDKLIKWGKIKVNGCYFCERVAETCNHLFLYCPDVHKLWTIIYGLLGAKWVMAGSARDELWTWKDLNRRRKHEDLILVF